MKINFRIIFIIVVLTICVISFELAVFFLITEKAPREELQDEIIIDTVLLTENFNNIFDNQIDLQNNQFNGPKVDNEKELIYADYINQDQKEGLYELNVSIPKINIKSELADKINMEINNLFYNKVNNILANTTQYTIYGVKYKAYVNDNILSLVISSTLKEGNNAQREIIKTYNYNLSSNKELDINNVIEYRKLSITEVQKQIIKIIENSSENAKVYNELGYTRHYRDPKDSMYKLENTKVYFIGKDKAVYIIYPYGNSNYTSELDLLVI